MTADEWMRGLQQAEMTFSDFARAVMSESTCERCGAVVEVTWCDVATFGDPEPILVPGKVICPTVGCGSTCPICHRPPGAVHSGACAPIVLSKLVDQVHVSAQDCRYPAATRGVLEVQP